MGDLDAVNGVPIVGQPIAYGIAFAVLLLVVFGDDWGDSLVTVAHEAGHMVLAVVTFRGHRGFVLHDGGGGATELVKYHWSIGDLLTTFAGYATPPLLGLGGAHLVSAGLSSVVLWLSVVLLVAALLQAVNPLAQVVTALSAAGVGWAVVAGAPQVQAAVAVGLVWLLLIGGGLDTIRLSRATGSDAYWLARRTLVPRIAWHGVWAVLGIVCLWKGGVLLLGQRSAVG